MNPSGWEYRSPAASPSPAGRHLNSFTGLAAKDELRGPPLRVSSSAVPAVGLRGGRNSPLPCPADLPLRVGIHGGPPPPPRRRRGPPRAPPQPPRPPPPPPPAPTHT